MENLGLKKYMVFSEGGGSQAVFTDHHDNAVGYAEEFAKEDGCKFVAIYTYDSHAEIKGLLWHEKKANGVSRKSADNAPSRNRKKWSESEQATIINCVNAKVEPADIAKELNRTEKSVRCRISILRSAGRIH
jgi:hypothetical protein